MTRSIALDASNAKAWSLRGVARHSLKQTDAALADLVKAVDLDPKLSMAWNNLGWARMMAKDWKRALHCFDKAIECEPGGWYAYVHRAKVRDQQGDLAGERDDLEKALAIPGLPPSEADATRVKLENLRNRR